MDVATEASDDTGERRFSFPRALLIGLTGSVIFLVGYVLDLILRGVPRAWAGVAVPAGGALLAGISAIINSFLDRPSPPGPGSDPQDLRPSRPRRGAVALPTGLLALVLIVGGVGWGALVGTRYVVGRLTGAEQGTNRLVAARQASSHGLIVRIESVEDTRHFTRVTATVQNKVGNSLTLPLFSNCILTATDGTTLEADPSKSHWAQQFPPGSRQRGTITFPGHLPSGKTSARLSFGTVSEQGFKGPKTIAVTRIRLRANEP